MPVLPIIELEAPKYPLPKDYWTELVEPWSEDEWEDYIEHVLSLPVERDEADYQDYMEHPRFP